jgi:rod shape determining protein RodA
VGLLTAGLAGSVKGRQWRGFDLPLLIFLGLLIAFGLLMGYSVGFRASAAPGLSQTVKTLIWSGIGLTLFFVIAALDYHWLEVFTWPIYGLVLLLLAVNLAVGRDINGAQLSLNVAGLDFQFSEIAKVLMISVLASYLTKRRDRIGRLSTILGAAALIALPMLLVLRQPDLGTALVFVAILGGMLFMAGASIGWMGLLVAATIVVAPVAVNSLHSYQRDRLFCFLDPARDPQGACYQLVQAIDAASSGGWLGQGLTAGVHNRLGYLPVQSTDFIFAVVAEELGLVGGLLLLALFGLLIWRVLAIGWGARDALGTLVAAGLASMILFQVLVNVGMVMGIMPVTGIPLPFITYGGSSMISLLFGMGILQSIRTHSAKPSF